LIYKDKQAVADASRYLAQTAITMNPVALCNPTNLAIIDKDWKKCAVAGQFGNPKFKYDQVELGRVSLLGYRVQNYWTRIKYNCVPENKLDHAILRILENRVCDALLTAEIAASIYREYDNGAQDALIGLYGKPDSSFIMRCYDSLEHPATYQEPVEPRFNEDQITTLANRRFKAIDIRNMFTAVLDYYGFQPAWECVLDPTVKTIDARDKTEDGRSLLIVPYKRISDGYKMATLIGHEIESHIRGSENSRALWKKILQHSPFLPLVNVMAKSDDERFYEGVAKISDVAIGGTESIPHPYYTIATNLALNEGKSFGEVARVIYYLRFVGSNSAEKAADLAWNITRRIFRGATDTSKGFAFTKDYGYLAGYEMAKVAPPSYHDYSSMTLDELQLLDAAGVQLEAPRYPRKDAIKDVLGA
jgi:hypothetical protein